MVTVELLDEVPPCDQEPPSNHLKPTPSDEDAPFEYWKSPRPPGTADTSPTYAQPGDSIEPGIDRQDNDRLATAAVSLTTIDPGTSPAATPSVLAASIAPPPTWITTGSPTPPASIPSKSGELSWFVASVAVESSVCAGGTPATGTKWYACLPEAAMSMEELFVPTPVVLSGIPAALGEGLAAELDKRGLVAVAGTDQPHVDLIGLLGPNRKAWDRVDAPAGERIGVTVLTDVYEIATYRRLYLLGASVAHVDSSLASIVDVIAATARGEIVVPAGILAACLSRTSPSLTDGERSVLWHLRSGRSIGETAEHTFYSDRHVRRLLQSALTKAGTSDRHEAIAAFETELGPP